MSVEIEQLVEMRIALKKTEAILKENEKKNKELEALNKNFVSTNKRLENDITVQVDRLDQAKIDNEELRKEKEGILSQFAEDNEKNYKELRKKEEKVANETQQNALRLIEIEKRESKLMNKENSNTAILDEAKNMQNEAKLETKRWIFQESRIKAENDKAELLKTQVAEKTEALKEIEKEINDKKIAVSNKELELLESIQTNQTLVAELNSLKTTNAVSTERLEKLNALFNEFKWYVTENSNVTIEQLEAFISDTEAQEEPAVWIEALDEIIEEVDTPEEEIIDEVDTPEETKDTVELSEMSYNDLVKEVKSRDIKLPQNAKKETLIDLLSK